MMARKRNQDVTSWYEAPTPDICPLCGRVVPKEQRDEHHLVPKSRGGRETQVLHRKRLMTVPGVGPVVSLAYVSTIDIPSRFRHSRAVGVVLGLTPVLNQSGESKRIGHVSLCGDAMMRRLLYEAAQTMLTRVVKWCWLKAWAMNIAKRHGNPTVGGLSADPGEKRGPRKTLNAVQVKGRRCRLECATSGLGEDRFGNSSVICFPMPSASSAAASTYRRVPLASASRGASQ